MSYKIGDIVKIVPNDWVKDGGIGTITEINTVDGATTIFNTTLTTGEQWWLEEGDFMLIDPYLDKKDDP